MNVRTNIFYSPLKLTEEWSLDEWSRFWQ